MSRRVRGLLSPTTEWPLPGVLKNFLHLGKKSFGFRGPKSSGRTCVCYTHLEGDPTRHVFHLLSVKLLSFETRRAVATTRTLPAYSTLSLKCVALFLALELCYFQNFSDDAIPHIGTSHTWKL